ncbi:MAG: heavy metal-binding domain-containing protein [Patescibacteria group bacterium]
MQEKYTCPMHPEVVSDQPGRCPKCGMKLVLESQAQSSHHSMAEDQGLGKITWRSYLPLIVIILIITAAAKASALNGFQIGDTFPWPDFVVNFMAWFFVIFALFKLVDLPGFAEGYSTYDLLARKWFGYGYIYPLIELGFGLTMLAGLHPDWLLWSEFGVMAFSGLGVAIKLARREKFQCACLGTFLKIPLTKVTLIEDFGMAALAIIMLTIA